jgi:predicted dithiol-disulfide oxidoreductase (DUF899 family)
MPGRLPKIKTKHHPVVPRSKWIAARKRLLANEKAFSRQRERLAEARRALPWVEVAKEYVFETPDGKETLSDLFAGRSQLVIYHFMYDPREKDPCAHCSFWADHFDPVVAHLNHRDVTILAVSRAQVKKLEKRKRRMGWKFKWVSSGKSGFNYDFHVSFTDAQLRQGYVDYNYQITEARSRDYPGISIFYKDERGSIYHTYSCFARGIDMVNTTYQFLDLVPKGRDEDPDRPQSWVRLHDEYGPTA